MGWRVGLGSSREVYRRRTGARLSYFGSWTTSGKVVSATLLGGRPVLSRTSLAGLGGLDPDL